MKHANKWNFFWPFLACLPAFIVLFFICFHNPHSGLMDDSQHLTLLLPRMREIGLWPATMEYLRGDLNLGVVRITYPPMVWFLYSAGDLARPMIIFLLNWGSVIFVTGFTAFLLSQMLSVSFWFLFASPFAIYYFHDFFLFPSLQEKLIVLFGVSLIYLCSNRCKISWGLRFPLIMLAALIGGVTKTNFVIFFLPATILLFWDAFLVRNTKKFYFILSLGLFVMITLALAYFASRGSYNGGRYSLLKAKNNIFSFPFFYLTAPLLISLLWAKSVWREQGVNYFIPLFSLVGFYFVFLPWGIDAYIQCVIISFVGASIVQAITFAPLADGAKKLGFMALIAAAIVVTGYRSNRNFLRMADLRDTLVFLAKSEPKLPVVADCPEGHLAMERYVRGMGATNFTINYWLTLKERPDHFWMVGDGALCPIHEKLEGCTSSVLQAGHFAKSFKVLEWNCGRS